jgi:hypothetical protein
MNLINKNLLPNCPLTRADILAAEDILGPNLGSLKGETARRGNDHSRAECSDTPINIIDRQHKEIMIAAKIMFVNNMHFVMITSRHIKSGTSEMRTQTGKPKPWLLAAIKE